MKFPKIPQWLDWDAKLGAWAPGVLVLVALLYYGSYVDAGLNLGGEGGTNAVVAMRLLEGQKPIVDTFLGYNLMWFYPLVALFSVTGPSYLAMKIFFFVLCTASALLAYFSLARFTRIHVFSFGVALLPLLLPGMMFRNYMGFIGVMNLFLLLACFVSRGGEAEARWNGVRAFWFCLAGLGLGLTFLIRIDLGIFFVLMYLGAAVLAALAPGQTGGQRLQKWLGGWVIIPLLALLLHLPFYFHAERNGFGKQFVEQYPAWLSLIVHNFRSEFGQPPPVTPDPALAPIPSTPVPVAEPRKVSEPQPTPETSEGSGLYPRANFSDVWTLPRGYDRTFVWSLYLPMMIAPLMVILALGLMVKGWWQRSAEPYELGFGLLLALGAALTLWPQYYFFRPDLPHLSEFMVPFYVVMGMVLYLAALLIGQNKSRVLRVALVFLVLLCLFDGIAYPYYAVPKDAAGGNAANRGRFSEFEGENGVKVRLKDWERDAVQSLYEVIMKYSDPEDFLTVYPYSPTIFFMTDRRSYEWNLYIDNATATSDFFDEAMANIQSKKPAVIVIDNRNINKNESSRFRNWAKPLHEFIRSEYVEMGEFGRWKLEVFVRPDKFQQVHAADVVPQ